MTLTLRPLLCIVTGGANGIGEGIIRRLHSGGFAVLIGDIDKQKGMILAKELSTHKHLVSFVSCDVKKCGDIINLVAVAQELNLPVYGIVNNAGVFRRQAIPDISLDAWNDVLATNLTAPFLLSQQVLPLMLPNYDGVIINLASGQSFRWDPLGVHYTSTKHAIRGLTKSLALALSPNGIRVNAVALGATLTSQALQVRSRESLVERGCKFLLGRIGQPNDIAGVVSFRMGDDARYITGQTIPVNGGADMP